MPVRVEEDVLGLDVPINDVVVVEVLGERERKIRKKRRRMKAARGERANEKELLCLPCLTYVFLVRNANKAKVITIKLA